jgi:hypothetical protein
VTFHSIVQCSILRKVTESSSFLLLHLIFKYVPSCPFRLLGVVLGEDLVRRWVREEYGDVRIVR